jgi:hypothetical protein
VTLVSAPEDSAEWRSMRVRVRSSDSAGLVWTDSVKTVRVNRLRRGIQTADDQGSIGGLPRSDLGLWAMGLIRDPLDTLPGGDWRYTWENRTEGRVVTSSGFYEWVDLEERGLVARSEIGAIVWSQSGWGLSQHGVLPAGSWDWSHPMVLLAHTLDPAPMSSPRKSTGIPRHNLAWVRRRMALSPDLVVVQVFPDGRRVPLSGTLPAHSPSLSILLVPEGAGSVSVPFLPL